MHEVTAEEYYGLSERDFASVLLEQRDPTAVLKLGFDYLTHKRLSYTDAPEIATILFNNTRSLVSVEPDKMNYGDISAKAMYDSFGQVQDPHQRIANGREWVTMNGLGVMAKEPSDAAIAPYSVAEIVLDAAKQLVLK